MRVYNTCAGCVEKKICVDNLLIRIRFIIVMIYWTGLAPWEFEFSFPGSFISAFLAGCVTTCVAILGCTAPPPMYEVLYQNDVIIAVPRFILYNRLAVH